MKTNNLQQQLKRLIRSELIMNLESEGNTEFLQVTEPQNLVKLKNAGEADSNLLAKFKIANDIRSEFTAFVLDPNNIQIGHELTKFKNFSWLIVENRKDTNKNCDIVVVIENYGSYKILLGELKSSSYSRNDLYEKFINSYYIIDYLVKLMGEYECKMKIFPRYYFGLFSSAKNLKNLVNKNSVYVRKVKKGEIRKNPLDNLPGKVLSLRVENNELVSLKDLLKEMD